MECSICYKDKSIDSFYEIYVGLTGAEPVASCIVEEGCKECLKSEDIKIKLHPRITSQIFYQINNKVYYQNLKQKNYAKEVLGVDGFVKKGDIADIFVEKGFMHTKMPQKGERAKAAKKFILNKNRTDPRFPTFNRVPTWGHSYPNSAPTSCQEGMSVADLDRFIEILETDGTDWSRWQYSNFHTVNREQLSKLQQEGYVVIDKGGGVSFRWNTKHDLKACRYCGNVLPVDSFDGGDKRAGAITCECRNCRSTRNNLAYSYKSEEEKIEHREKTRRWIKRNKEKVRNYEKTPQRRMITAIRKRLKDFMRTRPCNYNKEVGLTNEEFSHWVESLWAEGMSWENYGSGENRDHKGAWHIDHKIPLSRWETHGKMLEGHFEGMSPNHYLNLQPLWGLDNMKKSNKCNMNK
jgi:hypothetical protein